MPQFAFNKNKFVIFLRRKFYEISLKTSYFKSHFKALKIQEKIQRIIPIETKSFSENIKFVHAFCNK